MPWAMVLLAQGSALGAQGEKVKNTTNATANAYGGNIQYIV